VRKILTFIAFFSIAAFPASGGGGCAESRSSVSNVLPYHLVELGQMHDCYFTIEEGWDSQNPVDTIATRTVEGSPEVSLDAELRRLTKMMPNFAYQVDNAQPRIIHIIDQRLLGIEGYAMDSVIVHLEFSGKLKDLPGELHKQGVPVFYPDYISFGGGETRDLTTEAHLTADGLTVREALSNSVRLRGRKGRILWRAKTKFGNGEETEVYYP
jgi:hypothetical protein